MIPAFTLHPMQGLLLLFIGLAIGYWAGHREGRNCSCPGRFKVLPKDEP